MVMRAKGGERKMSDQAMKVLEDALELERQYDFARAKEIYTDLLSNCSDSQVGEKARGRMEDIDHLIAERAIYERIDENGKRVLTDIGINTAENQTLMDLLMDADAIDFENETAIFIPLKRSYIDCCMEQVPRQMAADPGCNCFGTGATPPFLKRAYNDELRPANRDEFAEIVDTVGNQADDVGIFSLPVATDKSTSAYECACLMEKGFDGLKMTATKTMSDDEIASLWSAIRETLRESIDHGGSAWEQDLYGEKGRWDQSFFHVAYREGQPCPECGTAVQKIKTGSTRGFICPQCQPL